MSNNVQAGHKQKQSYANTRTTGISSYTAPMIPSTNPTPIGGYKPMFYNQADTEGVTPTFQSIIGRNPGQYDEFREYVNDAGMRLQIPFKDGQPLYPIPEGYTYVDPEATKTEDVKVKEATPQSTSVLQQEQDGGDPEDPPSVIGVTTWAHGKSRFGTSIVFSPCTPNIRTLTRPSCSGSLMSITIPKNQRVSSP